MKPAPQQVEEDVFVGSRQTPPPELEVSSRRNGLLEDLVVLGYLPVPEANTGCGSRSSRPKTPTTIRVSLFKSEDTLMDYLVRIRVRRPRLERHPVARWPRDVLPSGSHVVAAG